MAIAANVFLSDPNGAQPLDDELCGLVKWCADASYFARHIPQLVAQGGGTPAIAAMPPWQMDVLLSTNAPAAVLRAECPQSNVRLSVLSAELIDVVANFTRTAFDRKATRRRYRWKHGGKEVGYMLGGPEHAAIDAAWLAKWAMVGLTQYDLILVLDLDIDLLIKGRSHPFGREAFIAEVARVWAEEIPPFVASSARLLSSLDGSGLINMGSVWLRPSAALYAEGVSILRTNLFSLERGFANAGPPSALLPADLLHTRSPVFNQTRTMADSDAYKHDSWNFVAGSADQGLFPLVFAIKHAQLRLARRAGYTVQHYLGRYKPWKGQRPSCPPYFAELGLLSDVASPGARSGAEQRGAVALPTRAHDLAAAATDEHCEDYWQLVNEDGAPPPEYAASTCWPRLRAQASRLVALAGASKGGDAFVRTCHAREQALF